MALDNFRTIELIWDRANKSIIKTVKTASSDTTGRYLSVKVLDVGQEVTLNGASLQLYWEHPNFNTRGTDDFEVINNGGLFKMTFSEEMLTNIGELDAYLVLTLPDGKIASDVFPIKVFKGTDNGVVIPSNGQDVAIKALQTALDKLKLIEDGADVAIFEDGSVTAPKLADSAVTSIKIADGSITNAKLDTHYAYGGRIFNADNLNNYTKAGTYHKTAGASPSNLPAELVNEDVILVVENARITSTITWYIQTLYAMNNPEEYYVRAVKGGETPPGFKKFGRVKMNITDTNLSNAVTEGEYLGLSTTSYTDLPEGMRGLSFLMSVETFSANSGFVIQSIYQTSGNIQNSYKRFIQVNPKNVGPWFKDYSLISGSKTLSDQKVVIIGDSQIEGGHLLDGYIANRTGAEVIRIGFGGCRMARVPEGHNRYIYNEMSGVSIAETIISQNFANLDAAALNLATNHNDDNRPQVATLKSINWSDIDTVIFTYMTNDYTSLVPLGDDDSTDTTEFVGAMNRITEVLNSSHPHIQLGFVSATYRSRMDQGDGKNSDISQNNLGNYLYDYVEKGRVVAKKNKIPFLDLYYTSGINKHNADSLLSDGLHWSETGQRIISRKMGGWLSSVM